MMFSNLFFRQLLELIDDLQKNIDNYKREYAELITEKENIKNEMLKVQEKVERSKKLISVSIKTQIYHYS